MPRMTVMFSMCSLNSVYTMIVQKTRLDMLNFVEANNQQYKWDCHVFFTMHIIYLDTWLKKMAYWGTKADELAIYALSDMLNVHSFRHGPQ